MSVASRICPRGPLHDRRTDISFSCVVCLLIVFNPGNSNVSAEGFIDPGYRSCTLLSGMVLQIANVTLSTTGLGPRTTPTVNTTSPRLVLYSYY